MFLTKSPEGTVLTPFEGYMSIFTDVNEDFEPNGRWVLGISHFDLASYDTIEQAKEEFEAIILAYNDYLVNVSDKTRTLVVFQLSKGKE